MLAERLASHPPALRSSAPAFLLGVLLFAVVLAPHLAWLMIPLHVPAPVIPASSSRMSYLPGDGAKVWSPVLFSLPSSAGFSGALRKQGARVRPPLGEPLDLAKTLPAPVPDIKPPSLWRWAPAANGWIPLALAQAPASDKPSDPAWAWTFRWLGGEGPAVQSFRPPPISVDPGPNRMEGTMEVDAFGQVTHVLLEPGGSSVPGRREALLALRSLRVQRGQGPLRLRFQLTLEATKEAP